MLSDKFFLLPKPNPLEKRTLKIKNDSVNEIDLKAVLGFNIEKYLILSSFWKVYYL